MNDTPTQTSRRERVYRVVDITATPSSPTRTHSILQPDGLVKDYVFRSGKETEVGPSDVGHFLKIPEFIVTDPATGERCKPLPKDEDRSAVGYKPLPNHLVVARWDELTLESLLVRASSMPGNPGFRQNTRKEAVVEWMTENADKARAPTGAPPPSSPANPDDDSGVELFEDDELTAEELNKIMGSGD